MENDISWSTFLEGGKMSRKIMFMPPILYIRYMYVNRTTTIGMINPITYQAFSDRFIIESESDNLSSFFKIK